MIVIEGLLKCFGRAIAVNNVSLTINAGESVALWGVNGAGKTTLIRCLLGLLPFSGAIRICGLDARRFGKQARQVIGYVPQELGFYDDLRVGEAIAFFARLKRQPVREVDDILSQVGLMGHAGKRIRELSGGMKQRLALAIALLGDPPILVLDEVTASLDACGREEFVALLSHLARNGQWATLFASHRPEEIRALAGRVVTLDAGRMVGDQPTDQWLETRERTSLLHLTMDPAQCASAIAVLRAGGFDARMNGQGIFVVASPGRRGVPLQRLAQADIHIDDIDIVSPGQAGDGGKP